VIAEALAGQMNKIKGGIEVGRALEHGALVRVAGDLPLGSVFNQLNTMEKHGNRSVNDVCKLRGQRGFHP
jgi:hypothetical protein